MVGRRVKKIRQERRLSRNELAWLVGISESYLRRIEAGHNPGIKAVVRIAAVLEIEARLLLEQKEM